MESHDPVLDDELRRAFAAAAEPVQGLGVRPEAIRTAVARRYRKRRLAGYTTAASLVGAAALAAAFLVPRGDDRALWTDADGPTTTAPSPSTTGTTVTPDETTSTTGTTGATGPAGVSLPTSSSTSSTSSTSSSTTSSTEAPPLPDFPPQRLGLQNGDRAWALYLVIQREDEDRTAEVEAANAAAVEAGYHPSSGGSGAPPLACDRGALEAFGLEGTYPFGVAVYFATQANAEQAQEAFQARGVSSAGVALVTIDCRD